jgi:hypothetical protein
VTAAEGVDSAGLWMGHDIADGIVARRLFI